MTENSVMVTICLTADMIRELQEEFDRAMIAQGQFTFIPRRLLELAAIVLDAADHEKR